MYMRKNAIYILAGMALTACRPSQSLENRLKEAIDGKKAEIGIAVIAGKDTITVNNDAEYPMMSVVKLHQALATSDYLYSNGLDLNDTIHISKKELKDNTYSPLRDKYPNGNIDITYAKLMEYTLQQSDNNACDILFRRTADLCRTDSFIRTLGIDKFAISVNEDDMHVNPKLCYSNWTTPLEAAKLIDAAFTREIVPNPYLSFIRSTMSNCTTGKDRLPFPLEGKDASIAHKTGTSDRDADGILTAINDVGYISLPDGRHYSIAVFVKNSQESDSETAGIIAEISEIVYDYICMKQNNE